MSYILTEVALEMMGFKLYDVHGNPMPMDLTNDDEFDSDEETEDPFLQDILGIPRPSKDVKNNKQDVKASKQAKTDKKDFNKLSEPSVIDAALIAEDETKPSYGINKLKIDGKIKVKTSEGADSTATGVNVNTPAFQLPDAQPITKNYIVRIKKIMGNLNKDVRRNQLEYMRTNQSRLKKMEYDPKFVPKELIHSFITREINKVSNEIKVTKFFRKQIEKHVMNMDPALYRSALTTLQDAIKKSNIAIPDGPSTSKAAAALNAAKNVKELTLEAGISSNETMKIDILNEDQTTWEIAVDTGKRDSSSDRNTEGHNANKAQAAVNAEDIFNKVDDEAETTSITDDPNTSEDDTAFDPATEEGMNSQPNSLNSSNAFELNSDTEQAGDAINPEQVQAAP